MGSDSSKNGGPDKGQAERERIREKYPDYEVGTIPAPSRVVVIIGDELIADSSRALELNESFHQPVYYFPRDDVRMDLLRATDHQTYCPFKGTASYWTIHEHDRELDNSVWCYEEPYLEVAAIAGYVAFFADHVDEIIAE